MKNEYEVFPTPHWVTQRFLESGVLDEAQDDRWLEPCAGDGAIVSAANSFFGRRLSWVTQDVREIDGLGYVGDYTQFQPPGQFNVGITNPPFSRAFAIVQAMSKQCAQAAILQRLNWLATAERHAWLSWHMPDVYVLPNRPSFDDRGTDGCEYAWFHWRSWELRTSASIQMLNITDKATRCGERRGQGVLPL